jgi:hypothetical protein
MKLGIFGDSYADTNGDVNLTSWPNLLRQKYKDTYVDGQCGISHWNTYDRFTSNLDQKFTHIIFCHTNPYRWPCLPEKLNGQNWNIHSNRVESYTDTLGVLNEYYLDLCPTKFTDYISESIFRDVNEHCSMNDIHLINIICFKFYYKYETNFPIILDIDRVSHFEKIRYKGQKYSMLEFNKHFPIRNGDPRICHLSPKNNRRLYDILDFMLTNKVMNVNYEAIKHFEWDEFDDDNDELFDRIEKVA